VAASELLGIRVEDIMSKNRSQLHRLTSFGRVRRSRITYPIGKGSRLLSSHVHTARKEKDLALKVKCRRDFSQEAPMDLQGLL
jgi:hypothetical protein